MGAPTYGEDRQPEKPGQRHLVLCVQQTQPLQGLERLYQLGQTGPFLVAFSR